MTHLRKIVLFFFTCSFCFGQWSLGLEGLNVTTNQKLPVSGLAKPSLNGFFGKLQYSPKRFGVSVGLLNTNASINEDYLQKLKETLGDLGTEDEHISQKFLLFGPTIKLGSKKVFWNFNPHIGYSLNTLPNKNINIPGTDLRLYSQEFGNRSTEKIFTGLSSSVNFKITENISIGLTGNVLTNQLTSEGNRTIYREIPENIDVTPEVISQSPLLEKICKCNNLFSYGAKLTFNLNPGKKDKEKNDSTIEPPSLKFPENDAEIRLSETDSIKLQWNSVSPEVENVYYVISLYKRLEDKGEDSLVFTVKTIDELSFLLPKEIHLDSDSQYKWEVQATDNKALKKCTNDCFSNSFTFRISSLPIPQYYQLLSHKSGVIVTTSNPLRIKLPNEMSFVKDYRLEISDSKNQVVRRQSLSDTDPENNRLVIGIDDLKENEQYQLTVIASSRTYYLNFIKKSNTNKSHEK